jgi:activator of 2-hydroxyglutaryl-CoA dehydratase
VEMASELISRPILLPDFPQLTGAYGAALYAMEEAASKEASENTKN